MQKQRHELVLRQESYVTTRTGKPRLVPSDTSFFVDSDEFPVYVQKPGYLGVLLVSTRNRNEKVDVELQPFDLWNSAWGQRYADRSLYEVLVETSKIQGLFAENQPNAALEKIEALQRKYPGILTLKFLKASCLVLLGEKARAKTVLEEALRAWPDNKEGQALYSTLGGRLSDLDAQPTQLPPKAAVPPAEKSRKESGRP